MQHIFCWEPICWVKFLSLFFTSLKYIIQLLHYGKGPQLHKEQTDSCIFLEPLKSVMLVKCKYFCRFSLDQDLYASGCLTKICLWSLKLSGKIVSHLIYIIFLSRDALHCHNLNWKPSIYEVQWDKPLYCGNALISGRPVCCSVQV